MSALQRDEQLFAEALAWPAAERGFLAQACNGDTALLVRMAILIAAHEGPESLLASAQKQPTVLREKKPKTCFNVRLHQIWIELRTGEAVSRRTPTPRHVGVQPVCCVRRGT